MPMRYIITLLLFASIGVKAQVHPMPEYIIRPCCPVEQDTNEVSLMWNDTDTTLRIGFDEIPIHGQELFRRCYLMVKLLSEHEPPRK